MAGKLNVYLLPKLSVIGNSTERVLRVSCSFQISHALDDHASVMEPVISDSVSIKAPGPSFPLPIQRCSCRWLSRLNEIADTQAMPSNDWPSAFTLPTFNVDIWGVLVAGRGFVTKLLEASS